MARSSVRIFNAKFANVQGPDAVEKMLASIPSKLQQPVQAALIKGGEDMVATYKSIAPVAPEFERHPGQMRDSAHVEADNGRALSVSVVVDAKDDKGRPYAAHVEYGHKTPDGGHVLAKPAFWPSYRVNKKKITNRVRAAIRQGLQAVKAGQP